MNLLGIRGHVTDEVIGRFPDLSASATKVDDWTRRAYARIWNAYQWPWRVAPEQSLAIVAGTRAYSYPADYHETWGLFDEDGNPLRFLLPRDFLGLYVPDHGQGEPAHYTLLAGQLYVGPTPASSATFKWQYLKRLQHYHLGSAVTTGNMSDDTDVPIMGWDVNHDDFHHVLIDGTLRIGMKRMQAPAAHWQPVEQDFNEGILEMVAAFGDAERGETGRLGTRVWGDPVVRDSSWL